MSNVCKSISHLLPGNVHDIHPHLSHLTKPTLTKQLSTWTWSLWSQRRRARETAAKLPIHIQELEVWLLAYHAWWFWCWNCSLMGRKMEENHLDFWKVKFISWYLCMTWFLVLKFGRQRSFPPLFSPDFAGQSSRCHPMAMASRNADLLRETVGAQGFRGFRGPGFTSEILKDGVRQWSLLLILFGGS